MFVFDKGRFISCIHYIILLLLQYINNNADAQTHNRGSVNYSCGISHFDDDDDVVKVLKFASSLVEKQKKKKIENRKRGIY